MRKNNSAIFSQVIVGIVRGWRNKTKIRIELKCEKIIYNEAKVATD